MNVELFDRYIKEVGRHLPRRLRTDVEAELHSLLVDSLQDRATEETSLDAAQVDILKEFGPPAKVAAQYTPPHRYLIGPRVFDIYLIVAAVAASGLSLVFLVILPLLTILGEPEPLRALGSWYVGIVDEYLGAILAGFGSVTLVFAILERILPESAVEENEEEAEWDPRTLPEIEDHTRIQIGSLITETVLLVIALIIFNLFPRWIGLVFAVSVNGAPPRWHSIPLMAPTFFTAYLPLLNALWILTIGLNVVLLRQGRWRLPTRITDLALTVYGGFICCRALSGPPILSTAAITPESLRRLLDSFLSGLLRVALAIALIASVGEAIRKLYRVFRPESRRPEPA
jgi:hypothetical protein